MTNDQILAAINAASQMVCKTLDVNGPRMMAGRSSGEAVGEVIAAAFKVAFRQIEASVNGSDG